MDQLSGNKVMEKRKDVKKKPAIRQTLTSIYRMAKANPLLVNNNAIEINNAKIVSLPVAVTSVRRETLDFRELRNSIKNNNSKCGQSSKNSSTVEFANKNIIGNPMKTNRFQANSNNNLKQNCTLKKKISEVISTTKPLLKNGTNVKNSVNNQLKKTSHFGNQNKVQNQTEEANESSNTVKHFRKPRRSLSAQYYERKHHVKLPEPEKTIMKSQITQSVEDLAAPSLSAIREVTAEESVKNSIRFKSANAYKRRSRSIMSSVSSTPRKDIPQFFSHSESILDLQKPLNDWLKSKGESLSTFHHLKCFGMKKTIENEDENKENLEISEPPKSESYEDLRIILDNSVHDLENDEMSKLEDEESKTIVKDALGDLLKLIVDGYPIKQCEMWLGFIRQKYNLIEEEPQYWECRAAIDQCRGNITSAVECYKTSIIKGAEVKHIDESLTQLLEKFSLLNIEPCSTNSVDSRKRGKQMEEVRNIFKSSIIQFAVQERSLKRCQNEELAKMYIATPVRRSTRKSRSQFISTPGKTICNSLRDLDNSIQEKMQFKHNNYLH